jgi:hypothetical protein
LRAAGHDPVPRIELLSFDEAHVFWTAGVEGEDAVGAAANVSPCSGQLVGQLHGLGLRGYLDRHAVLRLSCPARDVDAANVLAFRTRLLRVPLTDDLVRLEVVEVRSQAAIGEVPDRSLCAEIAVQALEHLLVADKCRTLQAFVPRALDHPALSCVSQRAGLLGPRRLGPIFELA